MTPLLAKMVLEHMAYPPPPPNRIELTLEEQAAQLAFPAPPPLPNQPPLPNAQVHARPNRPRLDGMGGCRPTLTSLCAPCSSQVRKWVAKLAERQMDTSLKSTAAYTQTTPDEAAAGTTTEDGGTETSTPISA